MKIVLTGSIAFDYLMTFPGLFRDHILPDRIDTISLSFLVDSLTRRPGGIAANIAYCLALLGEHPTVMSAVGDDFEQQRAWLEGQGVDTSAIRIFPDTLTASFFVNTDESHSQIASFYPGAMVHAAELSFKDMAETPDLTVISPNDPQAMTKYPLECQELGIPYIYDPSQQIVRLSKEELSLGIQGCQALFSNDYEFGLIEEKTGLRAQDIVRHADWIVITRGAEGADIITDQATTRIPVVPPTTIADPTGVGDAFRGGFLKGYINNLRLKRCGEMGALAATYCLEADGPQGYRFDMGSFVQRFREHFNDKGELDPLL